MSKLTTEEIDAIADAVTGKIHITSCRCGLTNDFIEKHLDDHKFLDQVRQGEKVVKKTGLVVFVSTVLGGIFSALWMGIKIMIHGSK